MDRIAPRGSRYSLPYYKGPDGKLRQRQPTLEREPWVDPTTDPGEAERQLEALRAKMRAANAARPQSKIVDYAPGAAKAFKTSRDLSDEELEGLDVFDPDDPPKAEPRPSQDGVISDSGWSEPKGVLDDSGWVTGNKLAPWRDGPKFAPHNPASVWGTEAPAEVAPGRIGRGNPYLAEKDLPYAETQQPADENSPFAGMPKFKDKPDGEQYLTTEQKMAAKAPLYAYLRDKMARRQRATSGAAYDNIEKGIIGQRAQADSGALLGALSQGASMMGTLGGKRAESTIVPAMTKNLNDSSQAAFDNWRGMRGVEEGSNANDLNVAKYISGLDQFDEGKKLKTRELYLRAAARKAGVGPNWLVIGESDNGVVMVNPKNPEETTTIPFPIGFKPKAAKSAASQPNWIVIGESPSGVIMANPRNPEERITIPFETGFGPRAAKGAPTPGWVEVGRDANGNVTWARKDDPSVTKTVPTPPGTKPTGGTIRDTLDMKTAALLNAKFAAEYASKTTMANTIDSEVGQIQKFLDAGDRGQAIAHAQTTLKLLNSTSGPDAVGAEEKKRLAQYLETIQPPWQDGTMFGADIDKFVDQLSGKSRALRSAANESLKMSGQIRDQGVSGLGGKKKDLTEDDHLNMFNWAKSNPNDPRAAAIIEAQKKLKLEK